ncbi:MAG: hypothetical protein KJ970_15775 [Candidatus Eisenbacteria bacterium]|uniref:Uncharacterized protein n=1 Tax=Eiseniibacteriota bacterium TaxID=2212470 RepID=A0A948S044_UNCEI|nr:hypothetical protein [Candidatus Eisenbacteria bacterium]MBU1949117.1 hypothetical protein [Candidatus Eisenbacteria bacterium]MBU2692382.1 hypothetical protein [Candidatus Eisenbacteria bacterium]
MGKALITARLPEDLVEEFEQAAHSCGLNGRERWVAVGAALRMFSDATPDQKAKCLSYMRTSTIREALSGSDWDSIYRDLI